MALETDARCSLLQFERMKTSPKSRLRLAWWNTSLAPLGKIKADAGDIRLAEVTIRQLFRNDLIDFLVLGEVSKELLDRFSKAKIIEDLGSFDGTGSDPKLHYDIGVLYRKSRCEILGTKVVRSEYARGGLKIALRFDLKVSVGRLPLHLFAVHWPSRLWCHENSAKRDTLGLRLRDSAKELFAKYPEPPQIVLIGDFNDDPFNDSLAGYLLATRDRRLAQKYPQYFYNPFWRLLGETHPHVPGCSSDSVGGTHYCSNTAESRWSTFDQIIVSSALIGGGDGSLELSEGLSRIWRSPQLDEVIIDGKRIFDHFPIVAEFESKLNGVAS